MSGTDKPCPSGWKSKVAVFMDRDGTICEEVGYLDSVERMHLIRRSGAAIKLLNEKGFRAVVITNQSGVARGFFSEARLQELHQELARQLGREEARLDAIYYCPHHPTEGRGNYLQACDCRKPSVGLLQRAAADLSLDLQSSYMIGDHYSDVECGLRAGTRSILVLTGHGSAALAEKRSWPKPPSFIAPDLYAAVEWILEETANR